MFMHEFLIQAKVPSWRANELWSKLEKKASHPSYGRGKFCHGTRVGNV